MKWFGMKLAAWLEIRMRDILRKPALTPALSTGERETVIQPHCYLARSIRRTLADFLPLPGGEGRGEGGRESIRARSLFPRQFAALLLLAFLISSSHAASRVIRVEGMTVAPGETNRVRVVLESLGNEKALGFNLGYNPAVLTFVRAEAGPDSVAVGANLISNPNQTTNFGRIALALALDFSTPDTYPSGTNFIADVFFTVAAGVTGGVSAITFTNEPGVTEISDPNVNELSASYVGSSVSVVLQCEFSLGMNAAAFTDVGGGGSVSLTAGNAVCAWSLVNVTPWISITSATNGAGSATVDFLVEANPNLTGRTGTVVVAGQPFTVTQSGITCTYALAPAGRAHGATTETNSFNVLAANPCAWSVVNTNPWVTILSGVSGTGDGLINYALLANWSLTARTGVVTVAGQSLSVTQEAYAGGFHFQSIHMMTPGEVSLTLTGGPLGVWSLEISGDLTNWASFASLTNATGRVDLITPVAESNRFYRAVLP